MSTERTKVNTRNKILEAAIKLFSDKGFNGTTTKEIAELADVNEALIFRYFSTKRDLYSAIIEKKIEEEPGIELPLETFRETKNDWLIFKSIAMTLFYNCGEDPSFMRLLHFSALEGHELSDMFFDTYVDYMNKLLSDYIDERVAEGVFREIDSSLAARAFIGMVINYIIVQELFGEKRRNNVDKEKVAETFVRIFLDGIKDSGEKKEVELTEGLAEKSTLV